MPYFRAFMPKGILRKQRKPKPPSESYDEDDVLSEGEEDVQQHQRHESMARKPSKSRRGKLNVDQLHDELDVRESEIKSLIQEKNELRKQLDEMEHQLELAHNEYQQQADKLQSEVDHHDRTRQRLKNRASGKEGESGPFAAIEDILSSADVVGMVEGLNQEVLQAAAFIAEGFTFEKPDENEKPSDEAREASSEASRILGRKFVGLLKTTEHRENPTLVQIALQASIHSCCRRIVNARHFDRSRYGSLLTEMCRGISEAEDQFVSGRWRALSREHFQRVFSSWRREPEEEFIPDIMTYIADVIVVAGVQINRSQVHETVKANFLERLTNIKKKTLRLNKAVVEEFMSADIEAMYHHPRADFDPVTMDDANAVTSSHDEGVAEEILCTTDLGLRQYARLPGDKGHADWAKTILLKAKVALPDSVQGMRESRERERSDT